MKAEDNISTLHRLREGNGKAVVEKGSEEERTEELLASEYFMHPSIERERRLLDEKRGKWIARRMEMIANETKERLLGTGVEYRVNKQAVEKKSATISPEEVNVMLGREQYYMELLLVCEVREWEQLFWNKFKAFLVKIDDDRVEEKERLTREWRANCWKRLNPQMHAAMKRMADVDDVMEKKFCLELLGKDWASLISQHFEGVDKRGIMSLSELRRWIGDKDEIRLRMKKEIEDTEFRLKRGSDLGRFDQFWDDHTLFKCRYSRSKWLYLSSTVPLEVCSHALKGNKNIIYISFNSMESGFDVNRFLRDLPWVTSMSPDPDPSAIPAVRHDPLYIKSTNNDLNTFAKQIKLDPSSTHIFLDAKMYAFSWTSGKLTGNARVLISFVGPTSGKSLILRVKHIGKDDASVELTLGLTKIQLNPSPKSSLTIDDITLYPIQVSGPLESDHLSFAPGVRNEIFIEFIGPDEYRNDDHFLNDIELLDEAGLEYMPHLASLSLLSN